MIVITADRDIKMNVEELNLKNGTTFNFDTRIFSIVDEKGDVIVAFSDEEQRNIFADAIIESIITQRNKGFSHFETIIDVNSIHDHLFKTNEAYKEIELGDLQID